VTDKPHFNGDGTFSTTSEMMPNPHGPHARDQAERGEWAHEFGRQAFARPDFVGWTVCGWVDTWQTMPGKQFKQHSGFFEPLGERHEPYVDRLRDVSENLYRPAVALARGRQDAHSGAVGRKPAHNRRPHAAAPGSDERYLRCRHIRASQPREVLHRPA
jgi:hypothetical protein